MICKCTCKMVHVWFFGPIFLWNIKFSWFCEKDCVFATRKVQWFKKGDHPFNSLSYKFVSQLFFHTMLLAIVHILLICWILDRLSLLLAKERSHSQTYLGCMKKGPVFTDPKLKWLVFQSFSCASILCMHLLWMQWYSLWLLYDPHADLSIKMKSHTIYTLSIRILYKKSPLIFSLTGFE